MSNFLHADFRAVFGSIHSTLPISEIQGPTMRYSATSQFSISEKSTFGHFEVNFFFV